MPSDPQTPADPSGVALALLGHDLRAALAEMRAGLHLIQSLDLPEGLSEPLGRCRAAGEALSRLIDQSVLVCLGQADPSLTGAKEFETTGFVDGLRQRWTGRAAESGHRLTLVVAGELPQSLTLDRTAFERIVANLIGNALAHTPPGEISVTLKVSGGDLLLLSVCDEGPGFPPDHLASLERDFTIPEAARRPGGGFGLQSVKQLVEAMGGRVNARNPSTGGAEVGVCLPLPKQQDLPPAKLAPPPDLSGLRLLMADDSATSRDLVGALAQHIGAEITTTADGTAVKAALRGTLPDLLILDDEMPGGSGVEVLRWLRGQPAPLAELPVILLTSHIAAEKVQSYRAAGADLVIAKPVLCPIELGRAVLSALGTPPSPNPSPIDPAPLRRLRHIAGKEAAQELFARLEEDLIAAQTGLQTAVRSGDLQGIRAHSHVIIALAGTAGANHLHEEAVTLNGLAHANAPAERLGALALALDDGLAQLVTTVRHEAQSG
jgi:CheY-like chemotaxis protein